MRKRENPAGGPGLKKNTRCADRKDNTLNSFARQGFSSCVPCANCAYLRVIKLASGRVRRVCLFHGVRVGVYGVPGCEFMKPEGDRHA